MPEPRATAGSLRLTDLVELLRPRQYTKNLLLFAAPLAGERLSNPTVIAHSVSAFVLFCLAASSGYVLNDLQDRKADRLHPRKQHRPIADGRVSPQQAVGVTAALAALACFGALVLSPRFAMMIVAYLALTFTYSTWLKRVPWLELAVVSAGFTLRSVAGGIASDTPLTVWFVVAISAASLGLITGKRLGEVATLGQAPPTRRVLANYRASALKSVVVIALAAAGVAYAAWAVQEADWSNVSTESVLRALSTIPVFAALARYAQLATAGHGEQPDRLVTTDRAVVAAGAVWLLLYCTAVYLPTAS